MNIKQLAYIIEETGQIERISLAQGENPPEGLDGEGLYRIVYMYDNIANNVDFMEHNYYDTVQEVFVARSSKPNPFAYWNGVGWDWNDVAFLEYVRQERARKLYECDWTQVSDAPLTSAEVSEATTYRQALRDVTDALILNPENYSTLESVPWPTKPIFIA